MNILKIPKPEIKVEEDGWLKWFCNEAFFGVKRILPKSLKHSEKYDQGLVAFFGSASGHEAAHLGEFLINTMNHWGGDISLEKVTSYGLAATVAAPIIAYGIAPKYVKNFIEENSTYATGAAGVMLGASWKALEVLV